MSDVCANYYLSGFLPIFYRSELLRDRFNQQREDTLPMHYQCGLCRVKLVSLEYKLNPRFSLYFRYLIPLKFFVNSWNSNLNFLFYTFSHRHGQKAANKCENNMYLGPYDHRSSISPAPNSKPTGLPGDSFLETSASCSDCFWVATLCKTKTPAGGGHR